MARIHVVQTVLEGLWMSKHKSTKIVSAVIVSSVLLSGCGLLGGEKKEQIDPPKTVTYTEDNGTATVVETAASEKNGEEVAEKGVMTELYLVDKNGYVVPQSIDLPKTESVAKQAVEYLVQNGPVTEMLPNGFAAVIPADTAVSVDIKEKVATVNFSKEFKNYKPEDEMKIVQSITWTLTQFDSIDKVKLKMNGHELTEMPVGGMALSKSGLTRDSGINMDTSEVVDITNTRALTVYYLGGEEGSYYYVPVTKRISNEESDNISAVVEELAKGPAYSSNLLSEFVSDVALLDKPVVEDGKVTLNFNESIFNKAEDKIVSKHILNSLVLSLTEQKGIESVAVTVNGKAELVNDKGEKLSEPVTRPENVNTGSF